MTAKWHRFPDMVALADDLAGYMSYVAGEAIQSKEHALLVVAGGNTPMPVYTQFSRSGLDWSRVTIMPGDDRLVPEDSPLSNVAMLRQAFATVPVTIRPIAPVTQGDYHAAGYAADAALRGLPWPPDMILLGMGKDGHTASIFPGADYTVALDALPDRRAVGLLPDPLPPEAPVARVTVTRAAIAQAPSVVVLITGDEKRQLLEQALEKGDDARWPIGRVLAQCSGAVEIYWCP